MIDRDFPQFEKAEEVWDDDVKDFLNKDLAETSMCMA